MVNVAVSGRPGRKCHSRISKVLARGEPKQREYIVILTERSDERSPSELEAPVLCHLTRGDLSAVDARGERRYNGGTFLPVVHGLIEGDALGSRYYFFI